MSERHKMSWHSDLSLPEPSADWKIQDSHKEGMWYTRGSISLIISCHVEKDGRRWIHLSVALPTSLPSYSMLCRLKEEFLGSERKAIQIFAPKSEHVSLHPNCLHLWSCLDDDGLPDFRKNGMV